MKLYNDEFKERFLSQYENEDTQKTIRNVFYKSELIENVLEKDLANFNLDEIGKCISNSDPHSVSVSKSIGRFISQYLSFAIENGFREGSNINPLKGVDDSYFEKFVDKSKKVHYSYEEFIALLEDENMMNGQDQAFLFLIFEGIIGEKFSQLKELRFSDVDWENKTVYVKERNENINVSDDCIKYLDKAYKQDTYYQYNKVTKEFTEKELLPSEYIFKNVKSPRATSNQPVGMNVFYGRLHALKEILELEYLTPNALKQSGMLKLGYDIFLKEGILGYDQFAKIGERYNFSTITNNNYTYFNTFLMREFLNSGNLKSLYNIDVEIKLR